MSFVGRRPGLSVMTAVVVLAGTGAGAILPYARSVWVSLDGSISMETSALDLDWSPGRCLARGSPVAGVPYDTTRDERFTPMQGTPVAGGTGTAKSQRLVGQRCREARAFRIWR